MTCVRLFIESHFSFIKTNILETTLFTHKNFLNLKLMLHFAVAHLLEVMLDNIMNLVELMTIHIGVKYKMK